jgi:alpha-beta hydrolase superfamily lysophospholipase
MGTIITRNLLQTESKNYECVILSGYPNYQFAVNFGIIIGKVIRLFKGGKYYSKLLSDLSIGSFNKQIKNPRTNLDWLSYNTENVDKYISDPYCGFEFKTSAFIDLFTMLCNMNKRKKYINVYNMPMLLLVGEDDPCTGGIKGVRSSIKALRLAGFNNIKALTYDGMRHEILNETKKDEVINDIIKFLK